MTLLQSFKWNPLKIHSQDILLSHHIPSETCAIFLSAISLNTGITWYLCIIIQILFLLSTSSNCYSSKNTLSGHIVCLVLQDILLLPHISHLMFFYTMIHFPLISNLCWRYWSSSGSKYFPMILLFIRIILLTFWS